MVVHDPLIAVEERPADADADVVLKGLRAFNVSVIGDPYETPIGVFVRDEQGRVVGGLLGTAKWRWLYVSKLWLPESRRGRGEGARLMAAAECWARERDCLGIFLDTFEYQALPFYQKLGFDLYGTLEGYPPGYRQFYLRKLLREVAAT
ncbi:MAG: GNAT family N-acetyltransferase [Gemmatimonadaceae bacterium]